MTAFTSILTSGCLVAVAVTPAVAEDATAPPPGDDSLPPAVAGVAPAAVAPGFPSPAAAPELPLPPAAVDAQPEPANELEYARAGVLEVGGSAGLMIATGFRNVNLSPSIGWFVADHIELSGILGVSNIKAGEADATVFSVLVEPAYYKPLTPTMFGFVGMGLGAAHVSELGGGLAVAPRIGAKFLVGRSGILSPALSYEYTTHSINTVGEDMGEDIALAAVSSALRVNIGYTTMW